MTVYDILTQVAQTSSRNEKQAILEKHKDNEILKRVIKLAYDPMIVFYIKKIPEYTPYDGAKFTIEWALNQLNALSSRTVTGHEGIEHLKSILENIHQNDAQVIEWIIRKDLRAGFSEGTANKIWPKLVPEFPVMLCSPYDQKLVDKFTWPACAQLKFDGMRCSVLVRNGVVEYRSRNGKLLDITGEISEEFLRMSEGASVIYDGELWIADEKDPTKICARETGNGILLKFQKSTASEKENSRVRMTLWDRIPYENFIEGIYKENCAHRILHLLHDYNFSNPKRIFLVEQHIVNNIEEAQEIFQNYLKEGLEGIILKDLGSIWEDKRSRKQVKFKAENTADLICTGWFPGDKGKENEFRLGRLQFETSDGKIKTLIGTGFSDKQRDELTAENTVGGIWEVVYNCRITDKKTGQESLFLPRVICQRWDKNKADSSKDIK